MQRAYLAGQAADCLSFVFIAGYQSAVRLAFDNIADDEWWSFAVSEDKSGELQGVALADGKLSGTKTWVAASDHVDGVIVTAAKECFPIQREAEGAIFESYPPGNFLSDMSTGKVTLQETKSGDPISLNIDFTIAEPICLMAAGAGYVHREAKRIGADAIADDCLLISKELAGLDVSQLPEIFRLYCQVAEHGKTCGRLADERGEAKAEDWQQNGKLLSMYKKGLANRIGDGTTH